MPDDIRLDTSYPDHPKIVKLRKVLGDAGVLGHVFLLCHVGKVPGLRKGQLKNMDPVDIAEAAKYRGDPEMFVKTLVDLELLDRGDNGFYNVHDWKNQQAYIFFANSRSKQAKKAAQIRWEKRKAKQGLNAERNAECNAERNAECNAPSPSPSPSPSPKDIKESKKAPSGDPRKKTPFDHPEIEKLCDEIKPYLGKWGYLFAVKYRTKNLYAVAHCLASVLKRCQLSKENKIKFDTKGAWAYGNKILPLEDQNYNEREFQQQEVERRENMKDAVSLGEILEKAKRGVST